MVPPPVTIFFFSGLLETRFPDILAQVNEDDVVAVGLALPDILADADTLTNEVLPSLASTPSGDSEALADNLTDLHEVLLHTKEQVDAAVEALSNLIDSCVVQRS